MIARLTDEQGMALLGLLQENESGDAPDFPRIANELVKLRCVEWPYKRPALPTVLDVGRIALWAWLDPGTRADLVEAGVMSAEDAA